MAPHGLGQGSFDQMRYKGSVPFQASLQPSQGGRGIRGQKL